MRDLLTKLERKRRRIDKFLAPRTASHRSEREDVLSFTDFIERVNPSLLAYEHVSHMAGVLERVADGKLQNVMFLMPPRYFKSEMTSRLFPAYYLHRFPERKYGLASYGAQLAWELSEEARTYYQAYGGGIRRDTSAKRRWRTIDGGEMWADGVGGALLGRGYNCGTIDDPVDPENAHSLIYQRRFKNWYPEKWLSRREPSASVIVTMQRLGPGDPIEFLWEREEESPMYWHVVCYDEIHSSEPLGRFPGPRGLPLTCTIEPDWRDAGEILSPTRFSEGEVARLQRDAGTYVAKTQRQQRPSEPSGDFWRVEWFEPYDDLPKDAYNGGKDWDTAYTKDDLNSASAFVESYRGRPIGDDGKPIDKVIIYIEDCDWDYVEEPELIEWMKRVNGPHHIEQKATGKSAAQHLRRAKVAVREVAVTGGDKLARASGVQHIASNLQVKVNQRILSKLLRGLHHDPKRNGRQSLLSVTAEGLATDNGDLDLNDAFVQALNRHIQKNTGAMRFGTGAHRSITDEMRGY